MGVTEGGEFGAGLRRIEVRRPGVTLSCLVRDGAAPAVVLLHGMAGSAAEIVALVRDRAVVAVDQRGHGFSTRRPDDLSRQAFVDDVLAVVGAEPVDLVGQSMGGHTALLVAASRPDLVRRLVLIESGVGGSEDDYPVRLGAFFAGWPVPFEDPEAAFAHLGRTPIARAWVSDLERRDDGWWPRFDADVMEAAIRPVAEAARWDAWARVTAPTLLVRGGDSTEADRMVAGRPAARLVVIAGGGHDVHLNAPQACADVVNTFLSAG